jgi:uncharacterized protein with HEPN domain
MIERTVGDYLQDILDTIESCERFIEGMISVNLFPTKKLFLP